MNRKSFFYRVFVMVLCIAMLIVTIPVAASNMTAAEQAAKKAAEQAAAAAAAEAAAAEAAARAEAETAVKGNVSGKCGENLTWEIDDAGTLTISGEGEMALKISDTTWKSNSELIYRIVIEDGVTSIADNAFYNCQNLTDVVIPDSVISIGTSAFSGCINLSSVTMSDNITHIGERPFADTAWYNALPDGEVYIGSVLAGYKGEMPENTTVSVKEGTKSIGDSAFHHCSNLTNIILSNSVTMIGEYAFYGTGLTEIDIPANVSEIDNYAELSWLALKGIFGESKLTAVYVDPANEYYSNDDNGVLFNKDKTKLIMFPFANTMENYVIPDGVTEIESGAFLGVQLKKITIPESVINIGRDAFFFSASLIVHSGSYAEEYAKNNGISYEIIKDEINEAASGTDNTESDWSNPFTDVKDSDWYFDAVQYVNQNNLMNGVSPDKFAPNENITRSMFVTVLYRMENEPETGESMFTDIESGAWYNKAVAWASENGIVNGISETEFAPNANITREQMVTMLFRYAQYKGLGAVTLEENLHFDDAEDISEYAVSSMNWAVGKEFIGGVGDNRVAPGANATRAQVATMLMRMIETLG